MGEKNGAGQVDQGQPDWNDKIPEVGLTMEQYLETGKAYVWIKIGPVK